MLTQSEDHNKIGEYDRSLTLIIPLTKLYLKDWTYSDYQKVEIRYGIPEKLREAETGAVSEKEI